MSSRQRHVSTCPRTAPVEFPRASAVLHDSPRAQTLNIEGAKRHANVTHLAHDPILTLTCIFAPTNEQEVMVSALSKNCTCGISTGFSSSAQQPTKTDSQHGGRQTPRERNPSRARSNTDLDLHLCPNKRPRLTTTGSHQPCPRSTCGKYRTSCSTSTYRHDLWHWHTTDGTQEGVRGCQAPDPVPPVYLTCPGEPAGTPNKGPRDAKPLNPHT